MSYSKLTFKSLWEYCVHLSHTRPIIRGMLSYAVIWPVSNLINQTVTKREKYDYREALRYCLFGCFYVAPTLYCWIRFSSRMWPRTNFQTAFHKAMVEQFTYSPFAMTSFFFLMSILEGKSVSEGVWEVRTKFIDTFKTAILVWPLLQTINFCWISERNRVPYVSICSLGWTSYLAYRKHLDTELLRIKQEKEAAKLAALVVEKQEIENPDEKAVETLDTIQTSNTFELSKTADSVPLLVKEKLNLSGLTTADLSPYNKVAKLTLNP